MRVALRRISGRVIAQVGEHGAKVGGARGGVEQRVPIPPVVAGKGLEPPHRLRVTGKALGEIGAQRALGIPPQDALADGFLTRHQRAKALLVKIVGQAELGHLGQPVANVRHFSSRKVPQHEREPVGDDVGRGEGARAAAQELGLEPAAGQPGRAGAPHGHVLHHDGVLVLERRHDDSRLPHPQGARHLRLHAQRRHAALAHPVDGKTPPGCQGKLHLLLDDEILGLYLVSHRSIGWLVDR